MNKVSCQNHLRARLRSVVVVISDVHNEFRWLLIQSFGQARQLLYGDMASLLYKELNVNGQNERLYRVCLRFLLKL